MKELVEILFQLITSSLFRYFVIAGIPFLIFYRLLPSYLTKFKIQEKFAGNKDFFREILHSMQTAVILSIIGLLILFTPLKDYTLIYDHISEFPKWWMVVSLILSLIIHDTYFYWMHRLLHHKKLFNTMHLLHHKSTNPSPWTSYSFHLTEAITEGLVLVVIVLMLPIHPLTILAFTITGFIINVYGHLGYEIAPKWFRHSFLFEVLNTSVHHNLHHSKFKGNYGLYFRIWDRLMDTEHPDYVKEYDRIQAKRFQIGYKKVIGQMKTIQTVK